MTDFVTDNEAYSWKVIDWQSSQGETRIVIYLLPKMFFDRVCLLTIAAALGCSAEVPPERPLPEWLVKEMPKMELLGNQAKDALSNAEAIELIFLVPDENYDPPKKVPDAEYFNWWKVVSRVSLDENQRQELVRGSPKTTPTNQPERASVRLGSNSKTGR